MRLSLNRDVHVSMPLLYRHTESSSIITPRARPRSRPVSFLSLYLRVSISWTLATGGQKSLAGKVGGEVSRNESGGGEEEEEEEEEETRVRRNQFTKREPPWVLSRSNISPVIIRGKIDPPGPRSRRLFVDLIAEE